MAADWRIYLDESGDHTYRNVSDPQTRYLALTSVVVRKSVYASHVVPDLENLKRRHFSHDPDNPVILHRSDIVKMKRWFGVLQDSARRARWSDDVVAFFASLDAQVFTVVIDKDEHQRRYAGMPLFNPYDYSLAVVLNRIRGFLTIQGGRSDIVAEARGKVEDAQLQAAYQALRTKGGSIYGTASEYLAAYPDNGITFRRKDQNVAGLQVADMLAAPQKTEIVQKNGRPLAAPQSAFTTRLNTTVARMVNRYGQYLLD